MTRVDIVIPVYNEEKILEEKIEELKNFLDKKKLLKKVSSKQRGARRPPI